MFKATTIFPQAQTLKNEMTVVDWQKRCNEIETLCKSAYKKTEGHGSRFFEDNSVKFKVEKQESLLV